MLSSPFGPALKNTKVCDFEQNFNKFPLMTKCEETTCTHLANWQMVDGNLPIITGEDYQTLSLLDIVDIYKLLNDDNIPTVSKVLESTDSKLDSSINFNADPERGALTTVF